MPEITKISHGLTIGDLKFGNARPGIVEATLKPGETMEEALDELDERLNAWHRKRYPHLYPDLAGIKQDGNEWMAKTPPPEHWEIPKGYVEVKEVGVINLKDVRLKEEIEDRIIAAESPDELQSIKAKYVVFPAPLINLYNKRMQELSSGRPQNDNNE